MSKITVFGLDGAKQWFEVAGLGPREQVIVRRRLRRREVLAWFAKQVRTLVALEPFPGSHFWGRELQALGFTVKMIPATQTKAYRRGHHKNDPRDAVAIGRAALSSQVSSVRVKSEEQLQVQALYRQRELLLKTRIALGNQMRMQLLEFGVALKEGDRALLEGVRVALDDAGLPGLFRDEVLADSYARFVELDQRITAIERLIARELKRNEVGRALLAVPGIGPLTAGYLLGVLGGASYADSPRGLAARLGLVPRQHSSGDVIRLGRITKAGDRAARSLFIHGARAVLHHAKDSPLADWGHDVARRRGFNKAVVAVANKLARHAWAIMHRMERLGDDALPGAAT